VEAGMPPLAAIQAATTQAAALLKQDKDLGSISAGKFADLVAVPGNPLADIGLMTKVSFVMKEGVVYKQADKPLPFVANAEEGIAPKDVDFGL